MEQMSAELGAERNSAQQLDNTRMMLERQVGFLLKHSCHSSFIHNTDYESG